MFVLIAALVWSILAVVPGPASAQGDDPVLVPVNGRGWGHGRGMSQWGAQGYALDHGWNSAQILDHYYANTSAAVLPQPLRYDVNPNYLRVEIRSSASSSSNEAQIGTPLRFDLQAGTIDLADITGKVDVPDIPEGMAGRLSSVAGGMELRIKPGCGGDWNGADVTVVPLPGVIAVDAVPITTAGGSLGLLRVCHNDGSSTWYEGRLRGENVGNTTRTINIVSIEEYLRGVVPREVPSSWTPAALEAQAVAARSYALSGDPRYGSGSFADTCDTTRCQVYGGRYIQTAAGFKPTFAASTDAAIEATAGLVRVFKTTGAVARTEFSSSSGGYTLDAAAVGGFPAVPDQGDATTANPNKTWNVTLDLTSWVRAQGKGALLAIEEFQRTGNGPEGGHVLQVRFVFTNGATTMSGEDARALWRGSPVSGSPGRPTGLLSTWFTFDDSQLDVLTANGAYVDAVYRLFLQRDAAGAERSSAATALAQGASRFGLTSALSLSPEWAGVEIDDLYPIVFSRPADAGGRSVLARADGRRATSPERRSRVLRIPRVLREGRIDEHRIRASALRRDPGPASRRRWSGVLGRPTRHESDDPSPGGGRLLFIAGVTRGSRLRSLSTGARPRPRRWWPQLLERTAAHPRRRRAGCRARRLGRVLPQEPRMRPDFVSIQVYASTA